MTTLRPVVINSDKNNNNFVCDNSTKKKKDELEQRLKEKCRSCTRTIPSGEKTYQLKEIIVDDKNINNQTPTSYGDLLQQLLNLQVFYQKVYMKESMKHHIFLTLAVAID